MERIFGNMEYRVKVTVLDKKLFPELQAQYCAVPDSGKCPCYNVGDAISRYIYSALQGGSIMHGWTNDDKVMIACCNDGTRPVIFKIERVDIND